MPVSGGARVIGLPGGGNTPDVPHAERPTLLNLSRPAGRAGAVSIICLRCGLEPTLLGESAEHPQARFLAVGHTHAMRIVLVLAIAFVVAGCDIEDPAATPGSGMAVSTVAAGTLQRATVRRVVDGDTIVVVIDGREERLRYIGIDTPETVRPNTAVECFGREASEANKRLVEGRTVYLERDVSDRDRFGRLLRYVYVDDPSGERLFVNLELVSRGYAQAVTFPPDVRHADTFRAAEREAREAGRGLWGEC
jgi:micrococcal nuclease